MSIQRAGFKRRLLELSSGGLVLSVALFPGSCSSNAAFTNLANSVGDGAIDTVAAATGAGPAADAIVVQPLAGFARDLWSIFVGLHIPIDPIFPNELLVQ